VPDPEPCPDPCPVVLIKVKVNPCLDLNSAGSRQKKRPLARLDYRRRIRESRSSENVRKCINKRLQDLLQWAESMLSSRLIGSVSFNQSVLSFLWSGSQVSDPLEDTRGNAAVFHLHASQPQISSKYSKERKVLTSIADFVSLLFRFSLSVTAGCKNPATI
jgi:hypothetical protein